MNEFLDRMSAILETPVTAETRFRELTDWSSLKAFGILVTLENDYRRPMTLDEFQKLNVISELAQAVGLL